MSRLALSKVDRLPGYLSAALAVNTTTMQHHHLLASADRQREKRALEGATVDALMPPRPAGGTPSAMPLPLHVVVDPTFPVLGAKMPVAMKPQGVLPKTRRRHGCLLRPHSNPDRGCAPWRRLRNPQPTPLTHPFAG